MERKKPGREMVKRTFCPKCDHEFCAKCLTRTWKHKLGRGVMRFSIGMQAEIDLYCCACKTVNAGANWIEKTEALTDSDFDKQERLL